MEIKECESSLLGEEDEDRTVLRDRANFRPPIRYGEFAMQTEALMHEISTPETYEEAKNSKENVKWKEAMQNQLKSLKKNETWIMSSLPAGAKALPCKWVFCVKTNPYGSVDKYKARLEMKGFDQHDEIYYNQTFSPVAKMGTVRAVISIAASENLHSTQFDVSTAFLYGKLEGTIYMQQPEGFNDGSSRVCELKRSLYRLKQAPRL